MKPSTITYDVGCTVYNQPLMLTWTRDSSGTGNWVLRKEAADQRDDTCVIFGITDRNLMEIASALKDKVDAGR